MKPQSELLKAAEKFVVIAKMQARQLISKIYIFLDIFLDFLDLLPAEVRLGGHPPALLSLHLLNNSCHNTKFRFRLLCVS